MNQLDHEAPRVINASVHRGSDSLDFDATSTVLASGGWEGEVALWNPSDDHPYHIWKAHSGYVNGVRFSGDNLVTAGYDGKLIVWDRDGERLRHVDARVPIISLDVSGDHVLSGHADGTVRLWRLSDLHLQDTYALHRNWVLAVSIHAGTRRLAASGNDGQVFVWQTDSRPRAVAVPPAYARSLTFSSDGSALYGGGWFRLFRWDPDSGELAVVPTQHWGVIASLQFVPDTNTLASISRLNDSSVYFLDAKTGATVRRFTRQKLCGGAVRVSPNRRFLAATGEDGAVRIWDLETPSIYSTRISATHLHWTRRPATSPLGSTTSTIDDVSRSAQ